MRNHSIEILSPAGSYESLIAAVRSGADAVYLGAKDFSARRNAENFDNGQLKEAVQYCHERNVKVYITLNIAVKEREIKSALDTAKAAYLAGVDGVIISDLGLARLIKKHFPDLSLHASTQMSVHSPACIPLLKKFGFSRVVVSREMSKENLISFCKEAKKHGIEVEVFVHGALCMCLSGQCLMSSVLGARSGNRGLCAGPCRLPFSALNGTGYDLSLKDLSLFPYVSELESMGVASLKIEGRMKRPEYISAATYTLKCALDNGFLDKDLNMLLKNVFSRSGFTDGYYTDNIGKDMFGIRTKEDVNVSKDAFSKIHEFYRNERQSVEIKLDFYANANAPISLTLSDGNNEITVYGENAQVASNKPCDESTVKKSLLKLGGTPYFADDITADIEDNLYISASDLNALRRNAVEALSVKRGETNRKFDGETVYGISPDNKKRNTAVIIRLSNFEQLPESTDGISAAILPLFAKLPDVLPDIPLFAEIPRFAPDDKITLDRLVLLKQIGFTGAFCSNLSAISLAKEAGLKVMGGMGLNVMNSESADTVKNFGADYITVSAELNFNDISLVNTDVKKGIFAYGNMPLMSVKNCPLKNGRSCGECDKKGYITDRMKVKFPVRCQSGSCEILNSTPTYLADRLNELPSLDYLLLWFYDEDKNTVLKTVHDYRFGGKPNENYTRGLYYKNLL
ncbi:MAG: DUF3656 domain-containing protein [Clostridia bacterium]|nr:DUF3656 domain-containing protein [Clostridia bacterium]